MSRTLVEVEITKANQVIIKGLPVLVNPVAEHKYTPVGYYWIEATPIDFIMDIGDTIKIANQLRTWKLDAIKVNKYGKSVAYFNKYNDRGNRMDTFYMVDGVKYLFADTSGSARNGVVHKYREPSNPLEEYLIEHQQPLSAIKYLKHTTISEYLGEQHEGYGCNRYINVRTDGCKMSVCEYDIFSRPDFEEYIINNFNYAIITEWNTLSGFLKRRIKGIYLKEGFKDFDIILNVLKDFYDEEKEITPRNLEKKFKIPYAKEIADVINSNVPAKWNTDNIQVINKEYFDEKLNNPWLHGNLIEQNNFRLYIDEDRLNEISIHIKEV